LTDKLTLYHDASKGGKKQWSIWLEDDGVTVTVEWGLVGHKLQTSSDTPKCKGKPGSKSFKDLPLVAKETYERQIRKKREEGYREAGEVTETYDPCTGLDKNFVPAKPMNAWTEEDIEKEYNKGTLWAQRKRDGQRHLLLKTLSGDIKLYSRRMEDMTQNFPGLCTYIKQNISLQPGTILDGEIIILDNNSRDDFKAVSNITKSKGPRAAQEEVRHASHLRFMIFDVLYYEGKPAWRAPYNLRYRILKEIFVDHAIWDTVYPVRILTDLTFKQLIKKAKDSGWEGLVFWQHAEPTQVRLEGGSPKRVNCIKWKPVKESDFIATHYFKGSGNFQDVAGGLMIGEIDPADGPHTHSIYGNGVYHPWRDCGAVGTGFNDAMRKEILTWKFPCVVKIKYDRQEPTGKLRFPVFLAKHEDKTPEECIGQELEPEE